MSTELAEAEHLLSLATFSGLQKTLRGYIATLKEKEEVASNAAVSEQNDPTNVTPPPPAVEAPVVKASVTSTPAVVPQIGAHYTSLESFAWDQGEYNSDKVTVYIDCDGVGTVKDKVNVQFTKCSFDLTIRELNGKNYR